MKILKLGKTVEQINIDNEKRNKEKEKLNKEIREKIRKKHVICNNCNSELEIEIEDLSGITFGANEINISVVCGNCDKTIFLSEYYINLLIQIGYSLDVNSGKIKIFGEPKL